MSPFPSSLPPSTAPPHCPFPSPMHLKYINEQGFLFSSISNSSLCSHFVHQPVFRGVPEVWLLLYSAALSGAWNVQRWKTASRSGRVTHPCIHFRCYRWHRCRNVQPEIAGMQSKLWPPPQICRCSWLNSQGSISPPELGIRSRVTV